MVEKVARALAKRHYMERFGVEKISVHIQMNINANMEIFRADARAAIEAMREPTVAMHKAGTIRDDGADPTNAKGVYSVMIDAALKEGGK